LRYVDQLCSAALETALNFEVKVEGNREFEGIGATAEKRGDATRAAKSEIFAKKKRSLASFSPSPFFNLWLKNRAVEQVNS
jgi:hypothetical protein